MTTFTHQDLARRADVLADHIAEAGAVITAGVTTRTQPLNELVPNEPSALSKHINMSIAWIEPGGERAEQGVAELLRSIPGAKFAPDGPVMHIVGRFPGSGVRWLITCGEGARPEPAFEIARAAA